MSQFRVPLLQEEFGESLKLLRIVVLTLGHVPDEEWCHRLAMAKRTHLSLNKDAPVHRGVEWAGNVVCRPILGGLHHQYSSDLIYGRHRRAGK
jgi:hypothetical protein